MIRLLLVLFTLVGFLIFSYPFLVAQVSLGKKDPHARDLETIKVVRSVFKVLLKLAGVTVTVKGAENIPEDTAVLYVGNHRSYFDILAGYTTVPTLLGFVAKKEMEKIPLLRTWMVNVNCLFLDRKNIKEGLKMILQGIEKVKNGVSIWIFPEGTRNPNEDITELLPFKEGSLKIAEKSGCPVVPVAMTGTAEVLEKQGFSYTIVPRGTDDTYRSVIEKTVYPGSGTAVVAALDFASTAEAAEIVGGSSVYGKYISGLYGVGMMPSLLDQLDKGTIRGLVVTNQFDAGYFAVKKAVQAIEKEQERSQFSLESYYIEKDELRSKKYEKMLYPID